MSYTYERAVPSSLRDAGKDEKWLQKTISDDPTILGLGDVDVIQRERPQPTGGRIDLLLADREENIRYEVEIMLGAVDESHIVRSIEYWDVERRRFPAFEHRAVIVAERITNRFFNVIGLLNRAVPIVAIQVSTFLVHDRLYLNCVRVLDVLAEEEEEETNELVDRKYWENRSSAESLGLFDALIASVPKGSAEPKLKYNLGHIALATSGRQFGWFYPRKGNRVHLIVRTGEDTRDELIRKLREQGVECGPNGSSRMKVVLSSREFDENRDLVHQALTVAEARSRST